MKELALNPKKKQEQRHVKMAKNRRHTHTRIYKFSYTGQVSHTVSTSRKFGISQCSLFAEPLLAGPAVLDVLQHITKHGPLPALVLSHSLHSLIHLGT